VKEEKMKKLFKEHDLVKIISLMLILVVVLTWIIPTGGFTTGGSFTEGEMGRIGLAHISYGFIFALQNYSIQVVFLLMIGIFYGVVTKTNMYKSLVSRLAKLGKGKEVIFALVTSFVVALLSSILNNTLILILFMPFLVSVLLRMGLNKMSAFASTFGSILVGVLGATIGTDGLLGFIQYIGYGGSEVTITTELVVRAGIFLLAFILFNFFNVTYIKKNLDKKSKDNEIQDDVFQVEEPKKKAKCWPMILVFVILIIFAILAFVSWEEVFGLEIFKTFHENVLKVSIGNIPIFSDILGASLLPNLNNQLFPELGVWYLFDYSILLAIVTIFIAIASRMKFNDFLTNAYEGLKKFIKPALFLVFAYMVFVFLYWSPIMPTILNEIGNITDAFNPFISTIEAALGSFFNSDLGYLGFSLNYHIGTLAGTEGNIVFLIYATIYGLIQFITPISVFLLFGLSYMNISYKKWMGYIWKFFIGMLVCLLVIFALLTYI